MPKSNREAAKELYEQSGGLTLNQLEDIVHQLPCTGRMKGELIKGLKLSHYENINNIEKDLIPFIYLERNDMTEVKGGGRNGKSRFETNIQSSILKNYLKKTTKMEFNDEDCHNFLEANIQLGGGEGELNIDHLIDEIEEAELELQRGGAPIPSTTVNQSNISSYIVKKKEVNKYIKINSINWTGENPVINCNTLKGRITNGDVFIVIKNNLPYFFAITDLENSGDGIYDSESESISSGNENINLTCESITRYLMETKIKMSSDIFIEIYGDGDIKKEFIKTTYNPKVHGLVSKDVIERIFNIDFGKRFKNRRVEKIRIEVDSAGTSSGNHNQYNVTIPVKGKSLLFWHWETDSDADKLLFNPMYDESYVYGSRQESRENEINYNNDAFFIEKNDANLVLNYDNKFAWSGHKYVNIELASIDLENLYPIGTNKDYAKELISKFEKRKICLETYVRLTQLSNEKTPEKILEMKKILNSGNNGCFNLEQMRELVKKHNCQTQFSIIKNMNIDEHEQMMTKMQRELSVDCPNYQEVTSYIKEAQRKSDEKKAREEAAKKKEEEDKRVEQDFLNKYLGVLPNSEKRSKSQQNMGNKGVGGFREKYENFIEEYNKLLIVKYNKKIQITKKNDEKNIKLESKNILDSSPSDKANIPESLDTNLSLYSNKIIEIRKEYLSHCSIPLTCHKNQPLYKLTKLRNNKFLIDQHNIDFIMNDLNKRIEEEATTDLNANQYRLDYLEKEIKNKSDDKVDLDKPLISWSKKDIYYFLSNESNGIELEDKQIAKLLAPFPTWKDGKSKPVKTYGNNLTGDKLFTYNIDLLRQILGTENTKLKPSILPTQLDKIIDFIKDRQIANKIFIRNIDESSQDINCDYVNQDFDDSQMIFDEQPGQSMKTMEDVITQIESIDLIVPNLKINLDDDEIETDDVTNNEEDSDEKLTEDDEEDDEETTNLEGGAALEKKEEQQEKDDETPILTEYCVTKPDDPTCVDNTLTGTLVWLKDNEEFVENGEVYAKIFITKSDKESVVGEDVQQEKKSEEEIVKEDNENTDCNMKNCIELISDASGFLKKDSEKMDKENLVHSGDKVGYISRLYKIYSPKISENNRGITGRLHWEVKEGDKVEKDSLLGSIIISADKSMNREEQQKEIFSEHEGIIYKISSKRHEQSVVNNNFEENETDEHLLVTILTEGNRKSSRHEYETCKKYEEEFKKRAEKYREKQGIWKCINCDYAENLRINWKCDVCGEENPLYGDDAFQKWKEEYPKTVFVVENSMDLISKVLFETLRAVRATKHGGKLPDVENEQINYLKIEYSGENILRMVWQRGKNLKELFFHVLKMLKEVKDNVMEKMSDFWTWIASKAIHVWNSTKESINLLINPHKYMETKEKIVELYHEIDLDQRPELFLKYGKLDSILNIPYGELVTMVREWEIAGIRTNKNIFTMIKDGSGNFAKTLNRTFSKNIRTIAIACLAVGIFAAGGWMIAGVAAAWSWTGIALTAATATVSGLAAKKIVDTALPGLKKWEDYETKRKEVIDYLNTLHKFVVTSEIFKEYKIHVDGAYAMNRDNIITSRLFMLIHENYSQWRKVVITDKTLFEEDYDKIGKSIIECHKAIDIEMSAAYPGELQLEKKPSGETQANKDERDIRNSEILRDIRARDTEIRDNKKACGGIIEYYQVGNRANDGSLINNYYNSPNWGKPLRKTVWKINNESQKIYPNEIIECPNYNIYITRKDSDIIAATPDGWIFSGSEEHKLGDEKAGEEWLRIENAKGQMGETKYLSLKSLGKKNEDFNDNFEKLGGVNRESYEVDGSDTNYQHKYIHPSGYRYLSPSDAFDERGNAIPFDFIKNLDDVNAIVKMKVESKVWSSEKNELIDGHIDRKFIVNASFMKRKYTSFLEWKEFITDPSQNNEMNKYRCCDYVSKNQLDKLDIRKLNVGDIVSARLKGTKKFRRAKIVNKYYTTHSITTNNTKLRPHPKWPDNELEEKNNISWPGTPEGQKDGYQRCYMESKKKEDEIKKRKEIEMEKWKESDESKKSKYLLGGNRDEDTQSEISSLFNETGMHKWKKSKSNVNNRNDDIASEISSLFNETGMHKYNKNITSNRAKIGGSSTKKNEDTCPKKRWIYEIVFDNDGEFDIPTYDLKNGKTIKCAKDAREYFAEKQCDEGWKNDLLTGNSKFIHNKDSANNILIVPRDDTFDDAYWKNIQDTRVFPHKIYNHCNNTINSYLCALNEDSIPTWSEMNTGDILTGGAGLWKKARIKKDRLLSTRTNQLKYLSKMRSLSVGTRVGIMGEDNEQERYNNLVQLRIGDSVHILKEAIISSNLKEGVPERRKKDNYIKAAIKNGPFSRLSDKDPNVTLKQLALTNRQEFLGKTDIFYDVTIDTQNEQGRLTQSVYRVSKQNILLPGPVATPGSRVKVEHDGQRKFATILSLLESDKTTKNKKESNNSYFDEKYKVKLDELNINGENIVLEKEYKDMYFIDVTPPVKYGEIITINEPKKFKKGDKVTVRLTEPDVWDKYVKTMSEGDITGKNRESFTGKAIIKKISKNGEQYTIYYPQVEGVEVVLEPKDFIDLNKTTTYDIKLFDNSISKNVRFENIHSCRNVPSNGNSSIELMKIILLSDYNMIKEVDAELNSTKKQKGGGVKKEILFDFDDSGCIYAAINGKYSCVLTPQQMTDSSHLVQFMQNGGYQYNNITSFNNAQLGGAKKPSSKWKEFNTKKNKKFLTIYKKLKTLAILMFPEEDKDEFIEISKIFFKINGKSIEQTSKNIEEFKKITEEIQLEYDKEKAEKDTVISSSKSALTKGFDSATDYMKSQRDKFGTETANSFSQFYKELPGLNQATGAKNWGIRVWNNSYITSWQKWIERTIPYAGKLFSWGLGLGRVVLSVAGWLIFMLWSFILAGQSAFSGLVMKILQSNPTWYKAATKMYEEFLETICSYIYYYGEQALDYIKGKAGGLLGKTTEERLESLKNSKSTLKNLINDFNNFKKYSHLRMLRLSWNHMQRLGDQLHYGDVPLACLTKDGCNLSNDIVKIQNRDYYDNKKKEYEEGRNKDYTLKYICQTTESGTPALLKKWLEVYSYIDTQKLSAGRGEEGDTIMNDIQLKYLRDKPQYNVKGFLGSVVGTASNYTIGWYSEDAAKELTEMASGDVEAKINANKVSPYGMMKSIAKANTPPHKDRFNNLFNIVNNKVLKTKTGSDSFAPGNNNDQDGNIWENTKLALQAISFADGHFWPYTARIIGATRVATTQYSFSPLRDNQGKKSDSGSSYRQNSKNAFVNIVKKLFNQFDFYHVSDNPITKAINICKKDDPNFNEDNFEDLDLNLINNIESRNDLITNWCDSYKSQVYPYAFYNDAALKKWYDLIVDEGRLPFSINSENSGEQSSINIIFPGQLLTKIDLWNVIEKIIEWRILTLRNPLKNKLTSQTIGKLKTTSITDILGKDPFPRWIMRSLIFERLLYKINQGKVINFTTGVGDPTDITTQEIFKQQWEKLLPIYTQIDYNKVFQSGEKYVSNWTTFNHIQNSKDSLVKKYPIANQIPIGHGNFLTLDDIINKWKNVQPNWEEKSYNGGDMVISEGDWWIAQDNINIVQSKTIGKPLNSRIGDKTVIKGKGGDSGSMYGNQDAYWKKDDQKTMEKFKNSLDQSVQYLKVRIVGNYLTLLGDQNKFQSLGFDGKKNKLFKTDIDDISWTNLETTLQQFQDGKFPGVSAKKIYYSNSLKGKLAESVTKKDTDFYAIRIFFRIYEKEYWLLDPKQKKNDKVLQQLYEKMLENDVDTENGATMTLGKYLGINTTMISTINKKLTESNFQYNQPNDPESGTKGSITTSSATIKYLVNAINLDSGDNYPGAKEFDVDKERLGKWENLKSIGDLKNLLIKDESESSTKSNIIKKLTDMDKWKPIEDSDLEDIDIGIGSVVNINKPSVEEFTNDIAKELNEAEHPCKINTETGMAEINIIKTDPDNKVNWNAYNSIKKISQDLDKITKLEQIVVNEEKWEADRKAREAKMSGLTPEELEWNNWHDKMMESLNYLWIPNKRCDKDLVEQVGDNEYHHCGPGTFSINNCREKTVIDKMEMNPGAINFMELFETVGVVVEIGKGKLPKGASNQNTIGDNTLDKDGNPVPRSETETENLDYIFSKEVFVEIPNPYNEDGSIKKDKQGNKVNIEFIEWCETRQIIRRVDLNSGYYTQSEFTRITRALGGGYGSQCIPCDDNKEPPACDKECESGFKIGEKGFRTMGQKRLVANSGKISTEEVKKIIEEQYVTESRKSGSETLEKYIIAKITEYLSERNGDEITFEPKIKIIDAENHSYEITNLGEKFILGSIHPEILRNKKLTLDTIIKYSSKKYDHANEMKQVDFNRLKYYTPSSLEYGIRVGSTIKESKKRLIELTKSTAKATGEYTLNAAQQATLLGIRGAKWTGESIKFLGNTTINTLGEIKEVTIEALNSEKAQNAWKILNEGGKVIGQHVFDGTKYIGVKTLDTTMWVAEKSLDNFLNLTEKLSEEDSMHGGAQEHIYHFSKQPYPMRIRVFEDAIGWEGEDDDPKYDSGNKYLKFMKRKHIPDHKKRTLIGCINKSFIGVYEERKGDNLNTKHYFTKIGEPGENHDEMSDNNPCIYFLTKMSYHGTGWVISKRKQMIAETNGNQNQKLENGYRIDNDDTDLNKASYFFKKVSDKSLNTLLGTSKSNKGMLNNWTDWWYEVLGGYDKQYIGKWGKGNQPKNYEKISINKDTKWMNDNRDKILGEFEKMLQERIIKDKETAKNEKKKTLEQLRQKRINNLEDWKKSHPEDRLIEIKTSITTKYREYFNKFSVENDEDKDRFKRSVVKLMNSILNSNRTNKKKDFPFNGIEITKSEVQKKEDNGQFLEATIHVSYNIKHINEDDILTIHNYFNTSGKNTGQILLNGVCDIRLLQAQHNENSKILNKFKLDGNEITVENWYEKDRRKYIFKNSSDQEENLNDIQKGNLIEQFESQIIFKHTTEVDPKLLPKSRGFKTGKKILYQISPDFCDQRVPTLFEFLSTTDCYRENPGDEYEPFPILLSGHIEDKQLSENIREILDTVGVAIEGASRWALKRSVDVMMVGAVYYGAGPACSAIAAGGSAVASSTAGVAISGAVSAGAAAAGTALTGAAAAAAPIAVVGAAVYGLRKIVSDESTYAKVYDTAAGYMQSAAQWLWAGMKAVAGAVWAGIKKVASAGYSIISGVVSQLKKFLTALFNTLLNAIGMVLNQLTGATKSNTTWLDKVKDYIIPVIKKYYEKFDNRNKRRINPVWKKYSYEDKTMGNKIMGKLRIKETMEGAVKDVIGQKLAKQLSEKAEKTVASGTKAIAGFVPMAGGAIEGAGDMAANLVKNEVESNVKKMMFINDYIDMTARMAKLFNSPCELALLVTFGYISSEAKDAIVNKTDSIFNTFTSFEDEKKIKLKRIQDKQKVDRIHKKALIDLEEKKKEKKKLEEEENEKKRKEDEFMRISGIAEKNYEINKERWENQANKRKEDELKIVTRLSEAHEEGDVNKINRIKKEINKKYGEKAGKNFMWSKASIKGKSIRRKLLLPGKMLLSKKLKTDILDVNEVENISKNIKLVNNKTIISNIINITNLTSYSSIKFNWNYFTNIEQKDVNGIKTLTSKKVEKKTITKLKPKLSENLIGISGRIHYQDLYILLMNAYASGPIYDDIYTNNNFKFPYDIKSKIGENKLLSIQEIIEKNDKGTQLDKSLTEYINLIKNYNKLDNPKNLIKNLDLNSDEVSIVIPKSKLVQKEKLENIKVATISDLDGELHNDYIKYVRMHLEVRNSLTKLKWRKIIFREKKKDIKNWRMITNILNQTDKESGLNKQIIRLTIEIIDSSGNKKIVNIDDIASKTDDIVKNEILKKDDVVSNLTDLLEIPGDRLTNWYRTLKKEKEELMKISEQLRIITEYENMKISYFNFIGGKIKKKMDIPDKLEKKCTEIVNKIIGLPSPDNLSLNTGEFGSKSQRNKFYNSINSCQNKDCCSTCKHGKLYHISNTGKCNFTEKINYFGKITDDSNIIKDISPKVKDNKDNNTNDILEIIPKRINSSNIGDVITGEGIPENTIITSYTGPTKKNKFKASITISNKIPKKKKLESEKKAEKYWESIKQEAIDTNNDDLKNEADKEIKNIEKYLDGNTPLLIISSCKHKCLKYVEPIKKNDETIPYDEEDLVKLIETHSEAYLKINSKNNLRKIEEILVNSGINSNNYSDEIKGKNGKTLFMIAIESGSKNIINLFLENDITKDTILEKNNETGNTPILLAAKLKYYDIVGLIIKKAKLLGIRETDYLNIVNNDGKNLMDYSNNSLKETILKLKNINKNKKHRKEVNTFLNLVPTKKFPNNYEKVVDIENNEFSKLNNNDTKKLKIINIFIEQFKKDTFSELSNKEKLYLDHDLEGKINKYIEKNEEWKVKYTRIGNSELRKELDTCIESLTEIIARWLIIKDRYNIYPKIQKIVLYLHVSNRLLTINKKLSNYVSKRGEYSNYSSFKKANNLIRKYSEEKEMLLGGWIREGNEVIYKENSKSGNFVKSKIKKINKELEQYVLEKKDDEDRLDKLNIPFENIYYNCYKYNDDFVNEKAIFFKNGKLYEGTITKNETSKTSEIILENSQVITDDDLMTGGADSPNYDIDDESLGNFDVDGINWVIYQDDDGLVYYSPPDGESQYDHPNPDVINEDGKIFSFNLNDTEWGIYLDDNSVAFYVGVGGPQDNNTQYEDPRKTDPSDNDIYNEIFTYKNIEWNIYKDDDGDIYYADSDGNTQYEDPRIKDEDEENVSTGDELNIFNIDQFIRLSEDEVTVIHIKEKIYDYRQEIDESINNYNKKVFQNELEISKFRKILIDSYSPFNNINEKGSNTNISNIINSSKNILSNLDKSSTTTSIPKNWKGDHFVKYREILVANKNEINLGFIKNRKLNKLTIEYFNSDKKEEELDIFKNDSENQFTLKRNNSNIGNIFGGYIFDEISQSETMDITFKKIKLSEKAMNEGIIKKPYIMTMQDKKYVKYNLVSNNTNQDEKTKNESNKLIKLIREDKEAKENSPKDYQFKDDKIKSIGDPENDSITKIISLHYDYDTTLDYASSPFIPNLFYKIDKKDDNRFDMELVQPLLNKQDGAGELDNSKNISQDDKKSFIITDEIFDFF